MTKSNPTPWWKLVASWTAGSILMGLIGGQISTTLGAPGYFGGALGFVLTGMAALFVLAAKVAKR